MDGYELPTARQPVRKLLRIGSGERVSPGTSSPPPGPPSKRGKSLKSGSLRLHEIYLTSDSLYGRIHLPVFESTRMTSWH